jgi:hypothetical protein
VSSFFGIGPAVRDALVKNQNVFTLVGHKIYPKVLPQLAVLPALTYQVVSDGPSDTIAGMAGLFNATLQIDSWATNPLAAQRINDAVRLAIQGYRGNHLSVKILGIHLTMDFEDFEPEVRDYRYIARYSIWYRRENPDHSDDDS